MQRSAEAARRFAGGSLGRRHELSPVRSVPQDKTFRMAEERILNFVFAFFGIYAIVYLFRLWRWLRRPPNREKFASLASRHEQLQRSCRLFLCSSFAPLSDRNFESKVPGYDGCGGPPIFPERGPISARKGAKRRVFRARKRSLAPFSTAILRSIC